MFRRSTLRRNLIVTGAVAFVLGMMSLGTTTAFAEEQGVEIRDHQEKPQQMQIDGKEYKEHEAIVMFHTAKKLSGNQGKTKVRSLFKEDVSDIQVEGIWSFRDGGDLTKNSKGTNKVVKDSSNGGYKGVAVVKSKTLSTEKLIRVLKKRKDVKYAEPNYIIHAYDKNTYLSRQWNMQSDGSVDAGGNPLVTPDIPFEWNKGIIGSEDNIVAVVDTGIDYNHPDLEDNLWENEHYPTLKGEFGYDFVNGDNDPIDDSGHGTHCAGIIGAQGEGVSGVNQKVKIMALKILDQDGFSDMSHEIEAYNYINIALDLGEPVRAINNSWGGGEESEIFKELIDIVGEKGAVTVCSAGNAARDNDVEGDYPSGIDSQYIVSVAATNKDGKLAEYSNWGQETVDVAAPGSEILSTVSYDSYNPTIYSDQKRENVNKEFNDFETPGGWGEQTIDKDTGTVYLNGELYDPDAGVDQPAITIDRSDKVKGFESAGGMQLKIEGMQQGDIACLTIPYEIELEAAEAPNASLMARASSDRPTFDGWGGSIFAITEMKRDGKKDLDSLGEMSIAGVYIDGESSTWDHIQMELPADDDLAALIKKEKKEADPQPLQRELVIMVYAYAAADYTIDIDDLGLSSEMRTEELEKYDYMSGTSMAAPYISGALALKASELDGEEEKADASTLINNTISLTRDDDLQPADKPVNMGKAFKFRTAPDQLPARIGTIKVEPNIESTPDGEVIVKGSGLDSVTDVRIAYDEYDLDDPDSVVEDYKVDPKGRELRFKNEGNWINNIMTVKLTSPGRESVKRDVYLVNGKKKYDKAKELFEAAPTGAMTTDGRNAFWSNSAASAIYYMPMTGKEREMGMVCEVDPDKLFKNMPVSDTGEYGMLFGEDMAYANGKVYTVVEYGLMQTPDEQFDGFIILSDNGFSYSERTLGAEDNSTIYSGDLKLITNGYDEEEEEPVAVDLGQLPDDLKSTVDWTMAAYNGKIYFMGGYNYRKDPNTKKRIGITDKVWIYDPASKAKNKWTEGPALCEPRAGGKAIQSGDKLVYTMGYSNDQSGDPEEQSYPANLILSGNTWSVPNDETIEPYIIDRVITRGKNKYIATEGNISAVKGGILYTGNPVVDYGDTFTYDVAEGTYKDTGYNFITSLSSQEVEGLAIGPKFYGFKGNELYTIPLDSGLVNVTTKAVGKGGKLTGGGSFVPGNTSNVTVKANKNWKIKYIKVDGKKIKLTGKNTTKQVVTHAGSNLTSDHNIEAAFVKYKASVKVKKTGKGKVTGGKSYVIGKKAKIKVKAAKGYYIKSIKQGGKKIKVKNKATSKTFKFKVKKDVTVKVVFAKK